MEKEVPMSLHQLLLVSLSSYVTLKSVKWLYCGFYLHFLNDMEDLFMYPAAYITSWEKCLFKSFTHFELGMCVCVSIELQEFLTYSGFKSLI